MSILFDENEEGPVPTRAQLIHLANIWLDLELNLRHETNANAHDERTLLTLGKANGLSVASTDLLELLGLYTDEILDQ